MALVGAVHPIVEAMAGIVALSIKGSEILDGYMETVLSVVVVVV
jgi:hypothetical protein